MWGLRIDGLVANPLAWDMATFLVQPQIESISDIHCVTAWSRYDNRWQGVSARHLLCVVEPLPEARFIVFHSYDGYTTNINPVDFDDEDVLLAHSWEEKHSDPRAWRSGSRRRSETPFLEEREVGLPNRIPRKEPSWFLGRAWLP